MNNSINDILLNNVSTPNFHPINKQMTHVDEKRAYRNGLPVYKTRIPGRGGRQKYWVYVNKQTYWILKERGLNLDWAKRELNRLNQIDN